MSRRSLAALLVTSATVLACMHLATSASAYCADFHLDPGAGYSGPLIRGISCSYSESGDSAEEHWTVPDTVTEAQFTIFGADDSGTGQGGKVEATVPVTPEETLLLKMGSNGGASSILRGDAPLLVAGGGNGLEPNYVAPDAIEVEITPSGEPNPPFPANGRIYVSWSAGWISIPQDPPERDSGQSLPIGPIPVWEPPSLSPATQCLVPKLRGLHPAPARRAIAASGCSIRELGDARSRRKMRGRVIAQAPRAGTILPEGTKVSATVGRGPSRAYSGATPR